MKQPKDQFGIAFEERQETLIKSSMGSSHTEAQPQPVLCALNKKEAGAAEVITYQKSPSASPSTSTRMMIPGNKAKEDDGENEDTVHKSMSSSDHHKIAKILNGSGGDGLLQWGQRKRSKRTVGEKHSGVNSMLPPPPPPLTMARGSRGGGTTKLKPHCNGFVFAKDASSSLISNKSKHFEDKTMDASNSCSLSKNGAIRSASRSSLGKRSQSTAEKTDKKLSSSSFLPCGSLRRDKSSESLHSEQTINGTYLAPLSRLPPETDNDKGCSNGVGEVREWPRIYISLSRKEKEEDFFAMKGTKLPHRPKKRSKAVDRALQYCFPGMWLSDLTKARYEVRERKTVKKSKRRGLKGLENMETDSE